MDYKSPNKNIAGYSWTLGLSLLASGVFALLDKMWQFALYLILGFIALSIGFYFWSKRDK